MDERERDLPLQDGHATDYRQTKVPVIPSARYMYAFMYFTGCITIYLMRANLSVAIVCMNSDPQDETGINVTNAANQTLYSHIGQSENTTTQENMKEFQWSRQLRGLILSAFAIGYVITQASSGWLTTRVGGKWLMFSGISMMSLLTFLSPVAARASPYLLFAVQIGKGIACSVFYPSAFCLLGAWAPLQERSKITDFGMSGSIWGTIISFSLSGVLCESELAGGWPSVFYVYGMVGVVWVICWAIFVYDSPAKHPRISEAERKYIEAALEVAHTKTPPVPWKSLLTSLPFYAILVVDYAYSWGWYTVLTSLPQYMQDTFGFNIKQNGVLSSVPYLACWLVTITAAIVADYLIRIGVCRVVVVRKIYCSIGSLMPAMFLVWAGFLSSSQTVLGVTFLTVSMGGMGFLRSGHFPNMVDIAPRYAGLLKGIFNSNVSSFVAPAVNGVLAANGTRREWQHVFIVTAVLFVIGLVFYDIFAQGEVQPWAKVRDGGEPVDTDELRKTKQKTENEVDENTSLS